MHQMRYAILCLELICASIYDVLRLFHCVSFCSDSVMHSTLFATHNKKRGGFYQIIFNP